MEPITLAIAAITAVTTCISVQEFRKLKNKEEEIDFLIIALKQYSSVYSFEECDKIMIEDCSEFLKSCMRGQSFKAILKGKSQKEKREITEDLVYKLAQRMKINISVLEIKPLLTGKNGFEGMDDNGKIHLCFNEELLNLDPEKLLFTILHELRHAVQHSALRKDIWGFSDERKAQWLIGNQHYVEGNSALKYRAYSYQLLENDANAFTEAVQSRIK